MVYIDAAAVVGNLEQLEAAVFHQYLGDVEPASTAFSMSSLSAWTGATMISPAAILLTTSGSSAWRETQQNGQEAAERAVQRQTLIRRGPLVSPSSSPRFALQEPLGLSTSMASSISVCGVTTSQGQRLPRGAGAWIGEALNEGGKAGVRVHRVGFGVYRGGPSLYHRIHGKSG